MEICDIDGAVREFREFEGARPVTWKGLKELRLVSCLMTVVRFGSVVFIGGGIDGLIVWHKQSGLVVALDNCANETVRSLAIGTKNRFVPDSELTHDLTHIGTEMAQGLGHWWLRNFET